MLKFSGFSRLIWGQTTSKYKLRVDSIFYYYILVSNEADSLYVEERASLRFVSSSNRVYTLLSSNGSSINELSLSLLEEGRSLNTSESLYTYR